MAKPQGFTEETIPAPKAKPRGMRGKAPPSSEPDLPDRISTKVFNPPMPPALVVRTAPTTAKAKPTPEATKGGMKVRHLCGRLIA
jgi:hypothetical protein